jgi:short-subunit dehydrogenase
MFMAEARKPLVLVTGGSSGIGLEIAKVFAAEDHDVIIAASHARRLKKAVEQVRAAGGDNDVNVFPLTIDLSKPIGPKKLYEAVKEMRRPVDVLVNNAGVGVWGDFARATDLKDELAMMQLNTASVVALTKLFVADMVKRGEGKLLFTASEASLAPVALMSIYAATKAFVYSFALSLREELKDTDIVVTALLPGATQTDFFNRAGMQDAKFVQEGKMADPAGVARDGFDALMRADDHIVSPTKDRLMSIFTKLVPDRMTVERIE